MTRILHPVASAAAALLAVLSLASPAHAAPPNAYAVSNLVSNGAGAAHTDPNLLNAWGVAFNPNGFVWVANNHSGTSTLYDGNGVPQSLVVTVPGADGVSMGSPTGIIYNGSNDFQVTNGTTTGPARFIFASEDGLISGWAPNVDGTHALPAHAADAIYKGVAMAGNGTVNQLYATDFHNGKVDVYDRTFAPVTTPCGFVDDKIPAHYAPFGIQNLNGNLVVTYARQDKAREDDQAGPGKGFVDVFDADGCLLHRVGAHQGLNAPWGIALAPSNFGHFSLRLLVANFGDGTISAFETDTGRFIGQLHNADGSKLKIPGLWGIQFGNGLFGQPTNTLFFAAGPNDEADGTYGRIDTAN